MPTIRLLVAVAIRSGTPSVRCISGTLTSPPPIPSSADATPAPTLATAANGIRRGSGRPQPERRQRRGRPCARRRRDGAGLPPVWCRAELVLGGGRRPRPASARAQPARAADHRGRHVRRGRRTGRRGGARRRGTRSRRRSRAPMPGEQLEDHPEAQVRLAALQVHARRRRCWSRSRTPATRRPPRAAAARSRRSAAGRSAGRRRAPAATRTPRRRPRRRACSSPTSIESRRPSPVSRGQRKAAPRTVASALGGA